MAYAGAAERLLAAIGEPDLTDTHDDPRLSRIFQNKVIKRYPAFSEFYGMEEAIEHLVSYLKHAAQGLEEKKQILYLLGPVGGGKSSLAEKLKDLMQNIPFYAIKGSPVFESPLSLFSPEEDGPILEEDYGIPTRYLRTIMSPWAVKRLQEYNGDITKFRVVKLYPSHSRAGRDRQDRARRREQPGHLVAGRQGGHPPAGALRSERRGRLQLLRRPVPRQPGRDGVRRDVQGADQGAASAADGHPGGQLQRHRGSVGDPVPGHHPGHSNESEWQSFRNNKNNEAFLDRVFIVKVPYCMRVTEEKQIYDKLLRNSSLNQAPCAPGTLEMMAQFSVLTRMKEPENSSIFSKMRVYDGENLKDTDPKAKSVQEYRDYAGVDEGMSGISTRFAFKILSQVFNFDHTEVAANPVHLLYVLEKQIVREHLPQEVQDRYLAS
jgi:serine protein kinase